ncbi:RepB family protein, partial [Klebsiella pneumoniae]
SVSRKRDTHKAITVFIQNAKKAMLDDLCSKSNMTQAEIIELLIERESEQRNK